VKQHISTLFKQQAHPDFEWSRVCIASMTCSSRFNDSPSPVRYVDVRFCWDVLLVEVRSAVVKPVQKFLS
jgi:hypothetical protein